jgi:hypothetical protein
VKPSERQQALELANRLASEIEQLRHELTAARNENNQLRMRLVGACEVLRGSRLKRDAVTAALAILSEPLHA